MARVEWDPKPFNERNPFGRDAHVVSGDNIDFSRMRWEATKAVKSGTATPEQAQLIRETDEIMKEAVSQRSRG